MDTTTSEGRLMLNMLAAFAEFEADIRKERQADGIAKAKEEGVYRGRKASIDPASIARMKAEGLGATEIAKSLGITRTSVYRILGNAESAMQWISSISIYFSMIYFFSAQIISQILLS